jgi:hypothetical protein
MSGSAYIEGDDSSELGVDFFKWKTAQIHVMRRPACFVLAALCVTPVLVHYGTGGSVSTALENFVGFSSFGPSSSLGLCLAQSAFFICIVIVSHYCSSTKVLCTSPKYQLLTLDSLVTVLFLLSVLLCPACLLSFAAAAPSHGVAYPALLFAIGCFLIDPSLWNALPAAAVTLASNGCFIAYSPRDTSVYQNFMSAAINYRYC